MEISKYVFIILCFVLSKETLIGQQDSNLINVRNDIYNLYPDTINRDNDTVIPYSFIKQDGYIISFFYKSEDDFYNYNIIFVPSNEFTIPLIKNIVEKSEVVNKNRPLHEHYLIAKKDTAEFEIIFNFSWVVKSYRGRESDSLISIEEFNSRHLRILFSEISQYYSPEGNSKIQDSIGIVFKLLKVEGVFKLESYNTYSQMKYLDVIYNNSDYFESRKAKKVPIYGKLTMCVLDYRFISPIFAQVLAIEFKKRPWIEFINKLKSD